MSVTSLRLAPAAPGARIVGWGSSQPDQVVTNDDLAERANTDDQWIRDRTGIVSRRIADKDTLLVDLAVDAGAKAVADAGLSPSNIDTVLVANCTMLTQLPNAAAQVAYRIGVTAPGACDLNAACAGFCYGIGMASDLIRSGSAHNVLVIGAEKISDLVNWEDRSTAIIFADGAGAAVVTAAESAATVGIGPLVWGSAGDLAEAIKVVQPGNYLTQQGQTVFRWATTKIAPVALRAIELAGLTPADIDVFVPHQANLRIVDAIATRLCEAGARPDMRVARDVVHSGNTSAASIPLAVDHMRSAGEISRGDVLLLVGYGAGLGYAGQVVLCP
ncbi:beta-ketoacyl-ACP synthase 3 [Amycolatopsis rhabdoformis]|uniref:Beta-ketoacyl-ACP synthase 3 n=1 Tax=Amycolatopsis rhabdoformis TaxID=1448059 RepID=A0ABZ1I0P0_9PSEU|nr:beta-ketoacyl-ACP synthase 3 [Amycolatopsis rhabdoformis]WSE27362.1 beta-ketoacyl-ACP synthase 3 [Amycolatopsis rhabdoformis]